MCRYTFGWLFSLLPAVALATGPTPSAFSGVATGGDAIVQTGAYCPDRATTYLILEEMTVALEGVTRAQESLLVLDDAATASIMLARADAALALAIGRGSGARVGTLIDAALSAEKDGHPKANLAWFPLLKEALQGLPEDATHAAARAQIAHAEDILQGQADGDEIQALLTAKQILQCDPLHIPLRQSRAQMERLQRDMLLGEKPSADRFNTLTDLVKRALQAGLDRLVEVQGP